MTPVLLLGRLPEHCVAQQTRRGGCEHGFTPIFDELCREHAEAGKAHPAGAVAPASANGAAEAEEDAPRAQERAPYAQGDAPERVA